MRTMSDDLFRVLLPLKPKEDAEDLWCLQRSILPPHRTIVRRLYVHAPLHTGPIFPGTPYEGLASLEFDAQNATRSETAHEMKEFADAGFQVECDVRRGSVRETILDEADLWPADLVAIRTQAEAVGDDDRIGRAASALLSHARCPVLTYRQLPKDYRVRRVLLPIDFSAASRQGVEWGGAIAEITGAKQTLVHVQTPEAGPPLGPAESSRMKASELEQWRAKADRVLTRPVTPLVVEGESAAEGILTAAIEEQCDLIVLSSTGASLLRDIVLGSTARQVARMSSVPVLVIPKGNRVAVTRFLQKAWRLDREEARGSAALQPLALREN